MKANGGLLDEVIFLARTDDVDDLAFLDGLVNTTGSYSRHDPTGKSGKASKVTYGQAWEVVERGTMYIKIDDDIVGRNPADSGGNPSFEAVQLLTWSR